MIDLHTHSNASDGSLSPSRLLQTAAARGLSALALTDHDTIDGLDGASKEAEALSIRFIPGIEMEIHWEPGAYGPKGSPAGEFHLLGLGIRRPGRMLLAAIDELSRLREERNLRILDRMRGLNIPADYGDLRALSGGNSIGRPHFAALLVNRRIVKNREQAFSRYLGKGKPLYVSKAGLEFRRAVDCVKESGGIAVLAHPMSLYVSWGRLPDLIKDLARKGLEGIEAWHPTAKLQSCERLEELGKSLGLYITAGSDFHGEARPDRKLGVTAGGRKIEDAILERIPPLWRERDHPAESTS
ncbi:MAG: PHP domain-containing protein [Spirochaetaceae bacterium]|jgi:predicted metal-dependent phosphoesterase TrpH|nr:PHP domain-containing protein [Spirochaetaceae bacterium]